MLSSDIKALIDRLNGPEFQGDMSIPDEPTNADILLAIRQNTDVVRIQTLVLLSTMLKTQAGFPAPSK